LKTIDSSHEDWALGLGWETAVLAIYRIWLAYLDTSGMWRFGLGFFRHARVKLLDW
jgi:hypothetical protein